MSSNNSPPPSPYYDTITSDELFDSFMDVALSAEKDLILTTPQTTDTSTTIDVVAGKQHAVSMPLPLLLRQSNEPTYESITLDDINKNMRNGTKNIDSRSRSSELTVNCTPSNNGLEYVVVAYDLDSDFSKKKMESSSTSNTIITVSASPTKKLPPPDYPGARDGIVVTDENAEHSDNHSPSFCDLYAKVDKSQKTKNDVFSANSEADPKYANINGKNQQNGSNQAPRGSETNELYAVVDKSKIKRNESPNNTLNPAGISSSSNDDDDYESILTARKCLNDVELKNNANSDYAIIYKSDKSTDQTTGTDVDQTTNADYQCVKDLKIEQSEGTLSPEDIAFGLKRLQTEGQSKLYESCINTIERSAHITPVERKKGFFHFGRTKSVDKMPNEMKPQLNRRHSNIPSLCSGYLFKQGGTGITPKNWRLRWFELKKDNCLYYYKNEQDPTPSGAVMLTKYSVTRAVEANKRFSFKLAKGGARTYYFAANSEDEMKKWMKNLGEAVSVANSDPTSIPECSLKNVSVPAISISEPDCHGFLWKQGNFHKSWRKRYCVLKYGCLFYYEGMVDQVAIGVFKLNNYTVGENPMGEESKHGFKALAPARKMRSYYFYTESEIDCRRWIEAMRHSVASRGNQP